jgi:hypothetical protein
MVVGFVSVVVVADAGEAATITPARPAKPRQTATREAVIGRSRRRARDAARSVVALFMLYPLPTNRRKVPGGVSGRAP